MDLLYEICGERRRFTDTMRPEQSAQMISGHFKNGLVYISREFS